MPAPGKGRNDQTQETPAFTCLESVPPIWDRGTLLGEASPESASSISADPGNWSGNVPHSSEEAGEMT